MISRRARPLVLVAVGVALLLSAGFVSAGDGAPAERYRYEAEQPDDLATAILNVDPPSVRYCDLTDEAIDRRACAFESLVGVNGSVTLSGRPYGPAGRSQVGLDSEYEYVYVADRGFFEARSRGNGSATVLTLEPVSARAVADAVTWRTYVTSPDPVRRAVDTGSATTALRDHLSLGPPAATPDYPERFVTGSGALVERDGTYYVVGATERPPVVSASLLLGLRGALALAGVGLLALAVRQQRALAEEA